MKITQTSLLGRKILTRLCVLASSAKYPTPNNCRENPLAQFFNPLSYKFIVLGSLGPFPVSIKVWATICDPTIGAVCGEN